MARPYSYDLRQKAVEAVLNGAKLVEVSKLFGMSIRTVLHTLMKNKTKRSDNNLSR